MCIDKELNVMYNVHMHTQTIHVPLLPFPSLSNTNTITLPNYCLHVYILCYDLSYSIVFCSSVDNESIRIKVYG